MHQLEMVHRSCKKYGEENNRQRDKIQEQKFDLEEANQKIYDTEQLLKWTENELKRLVSLLSGETYQEGDNMMEAIEAYQQTRYLKEHAQDFLTIMTQNAPEVAAQELFEYFELEVPDSTNIEIETAKKLYDLWIRAQWQQETFHEESFEDLEQKDKEFFLKEVYKLWNR